MAETRIEHEIELAILERQIEDRSEPVEHFQLLRCPGMSRSVVFDSPSVDAALAQRAHKLSACRSRYQELVSLRLIPDDPAQLAQIIGIGKLVPDVAVSS